MGLDNGFVVKSNKRDITRAMLPEGIVYPFEDFSPTEVVYWRKNWGLRNKVMNHFGWRDSINEWQFELETSNQVMDLIMIIASFLDPVKWERDGDSIWDFDEIKNTLVQDIVNLALVKAFMENNPDVYLEFYDSY